MTADGNNLIQLGSSELDYINFQAGKRILALYPLTTTFYHGILTGKYNDTSCGIQFDGDEYDKNNKLIEHFVPFKYILYL